MNSFTGNFKNFIPLWFHKKAAYPWLREQAIEHSREEGVDLLPMRTIDATLD